MNDKGHEHERAFPSGKYMRSESFKSLLDLNRLVVSTRSKSIRRITLNFLGPIVGHRRGCAMKIRNPTNQKRVPRKIK